jgi:hypothetical protein
MTSQKDGVFFTHLYCGYRCLKLSAIAARIQTLHTDTRAIRFKPLNVSCVLFVPSLSWQIFGLVFGIRMAQKRRPFPHREFPSSAAKASSKVLIANLSTDEFTGTVRKRRSLFLSAAFPMFVPSLSW